MLIDLSVPLNEQTPVYPGDPATEIRPAGILDKDGFQDHYLCCGTHVGTHMDAPSHMIEGGKNLDEIPIERFSGEAVCIEITGEFKLDVVRAADIRPHDFVFFYTGMSERYHESAYLEEYPHITEDIAHFLVNKKVNLVGVDMCSPDGAPFPVHKILLGSEVLIIENLTNLAQLVGKRFKVYAFPVKLELDAAPLRVVAEL